MAHDYIEEKITKNNFETGIKTLVDAKNLFTTQTTLQGVPGDLIVKNIYTFSGEVVDADTGLVVPSEKRGQLTYRTEEKRIKAYKFAYDITDKNKRQNGDVVPFSANGASEIVWNKINADYYEELAKISKASPYTNPLTWDAVEDALGELDLEDYENLYLLVSPKDFSSLKKSLKGIATDNSNIVFKGQLMMVDGLSIVRSKKLTSGISYIAKKDTIINEVKMDANISVDEYAELEKETYVIKFAGLVYLANEKYAIKLVNDKLVASITPITVKQNAELPATVEAVLTNGQKVIISASYPNKYSTSTLGVIADTFVSLSSNQIAIEITVIA